MANILNIFKRASNAEPNFSGGGFWGLFSGGVGRQNYSKQLVTSETANKVSTFYSCVRNISEDIAKLPFKVYIVDGNGNRTEDRKHPAYKLLRIKPNDYNTPFTLIEVLLDRALRKGNAYAFIQRDGNGVPFALYFTETENVIVGIFERKLYYKINDPILKIEGTFSSEDVIHLRGMGNSEMGISVLDYAAESVGKAMATQEYAGKFYGSGANLTGLLNFSGMKNENEVKGAKDAFMRTYASDGIGAIHGNATFTKMSLTADEAQMLGSQEYNVKDVARWFRMPLSKLQTSDSINNIEALAIEYVNDTLTPWITRIEQEIMRKLFTRAEQVYMECNFDTFELLKGDTAAMERRIKTLFHVGAFSPNDALRMSGLNGIGQIGDKRYIPVNVTPDDMVEDFWSGKSQSNIDTSSPDTTGSGATNGNIN